ncbi:hypothetical protein BG006_006013 [Podila minutissima]|uniref:Arrestin-like N-terminal domain-containing protein n=1 Tax=Podila minutissima TaxID=64525 RepID=A0A9P5SLT6_9FUNG|nr:hypothetical protein BG006_006013 [Podila minutissima]
MAILDFDKDSEKSIAVHFHNQQLGPDGQPLYFHTPEAPAVIKGYVEFRAAKDTNGDDIVFNFQARAESKWTEQHGKATITFHGLQIMQEQTWDIKLNHKKPKTIAAGVTRYEFEVELQPGLPASLEGKYGWFHYRFAAKLHRGFPHRNMAAKKLVWVYSSTLPDPRTLAVQPPPKVYKQVWNDVLPFSCSIPSDVLYQGQNLPIKVDFGPFLDDSILRGQELIVVSAVIKLKQYTTLIEKKKLLTSKRNRKKAVITLPVNDGWELSSQGFSRTLHVDIPDARTLAATLESDALRKRHTLKLIMMIRTNTTTEKEAKELRMEMDVQVTAPRPEHFQNQQLGLAPPPYQFPDSDDDTSINSSNYEQYRHPQQHELVPKYEASSSSTHSGDTKDVKGGMAY